MFAALFVANVFSLLGRNLVEIKVNFFLSPMNTIELHHRMLKILIEKLPGLPLPVQF